ncbi:uncharacterized protein LOC117595415 [Esox lucius]|uniref:uncharacterized protein LOC117595415 n=1 Tax=Esox lucius TaxID=8010 RepID=UPI00147731E3|nr:uncharacterized protein LOC117595415 [Esox lucius]
MFSRNRFNGQHGTGATKEKVRKKRAPNPKVALVIRGKIHRLLQGSSQDQPAPETYSSAIEEEGRGERQVEKREAADIFAKCRPREEARSSRFPNGKGHGGPSGASCVGEVELNREGCVRIPCTLQNNCGSSSQSQRKRSCAFSDGTRTVPEHRHRTPKHQKWIIPPGIRTIPERRRESQYRISPNMNGSGFAGAAGSRAEFAWSRAEPKRPVSMGDYLDYNFNRTRHDTLLEEDEEEDEEEEESSAIIEHILKELKGINKIQEEISDLRDYLSSVRGSVEEVSSCVDAVLLEIEGIRSGNKSSCGPGDRAWFGAAGGSDGSSFVPRQRPVSAYGSLGRQVAPSDSNICRPFSERHSIHGTPVEFHLPTLEERSTTGSPGAESVEPDGLEQEDDEPEDTSEHSSDIPEPTMVRKLDFSYLDRQDGQDCHSISSLSSGHSPDLESDRERPSSSHAVCGGTSGGVRAGMVGVWGGAGQQHRGTAEARWQEGVCYSRQGSLEEQERVVPPCFEGAAGWDRCRASGGYVTSTLGQSTAGSSDRLSIHSSGRHYNSPASTSSREEWHSHRRRPQPQPGTQDFVDAFPGSPSLGYECPADCSFPQSSGYHSMEGHPVAVENYGYTDRPITSACEVDSYQKNFSDYQHGMLEESTEGTCTWTENSLLSYPTVPETDMPLVSGDFTDMPFDESFIADSDGRLPRPNSAEFQNVGFNVKRIGRAVLDFSSALRGALRKLEGPGTAHSPGDEAEIRIPTDLFVEPQTEDLPGADLSQEDGVVDTGARDDTEGLTQTSFLSSALSDPSEPLPEEISDILPRDQAAPCEPFSVSYSGGDISHLGPDLASPIPEAILPPHVEGGDGRVSPHVEGEDGRVSPKPQAPADAPTLSLSQCTTADSLSFSFSAEEPAPQETRGDEPCPLLPETDTVVPDPLGIPPDEAVEEAEAGGTEEHPLEMSQRDVRRLKCLRTFQQIMREKRETRRQLTSMTMSSFEEVDFVPGSYHLWSSVPFIPNCLSSTTVWNKNTRSSSDSFFLSIKLFSS